MILRPRPERAPDLRAIRARRRAAVVAALRRPGAVLDTTGAVPVVASALPDKHPPSPRPVASGVVGDLLDAERLTEWAPGRYRLDVYEPGTPKRLSSEERWALLRECDGSSATAVAERSRTDVKTLILAMEGHALHRDTAARLRSFVASLR